MMYGNTEIKIIWDTLSITHKKQQEIRHIPFTGRSYTIEKGRPATIIQCQLKVESISELATVMGFLNATGSEELNLGTVKYKNVKSGASNNPKPKDTEDKVWFIDAEFIALDPIPYDASTGDALYD